MSEPQRKKLRVEEPQEVPKGIQETDVGITQYISGSVAGFNGVLKQRYTDFLVNEIDLSGAVVHLTDEGLPTRQDRRKEQNDQTEVVQSEKMTEKVTEIPEESPIPKEHTLSPEHQESLAKAFGEEDSQKIQNLMGNGGALESERTFDDKQARGGIHKLIREAFDGKLDTTTTDENRFKIKLGVNKRRRPQGDRIADKLSLGPAKEFIEFTVYKENKETMQVAGLLSKLLRVPAKHICYAGTKDRRGVTVQRATIERLRLERLNNLNKTLKGIRLGGFKYADRALKLGDLGGNEFVITIKECSVEDEQQFRTCLDESFRSLKEKGFINYYGLQRFGTFSVSTHQVGKQVLLSAWKEAAELILSEQELVVPDSVEARKLWAETKDAKKAVSKMPSNCGAEYAILSHLSKKEGDYFGGIMQIPRNLRIMYGHAYQSYVWNSVASRRYELFGHTIVAGDLVIKGTTNEADDEIQEDVKTDFVRAKPVTQEEIDAKKYSAWDVVLPTPGYDILYPENEQLRQVYVDVMNSDGLDPFSMARSVREFSYAGSYRHLFAQVGNLEYVVRKYTETTDQLVLTDLDVLKSGPTAERILPGKEGPKTAVIVKMQLGVSSYATMALRELMKSDTARRGALCNVYA